MSMLLRVLRPALGLSRRLTDAPENIADACRNVPRRRRPIARVEALCDHALRRFRRSLLGLGTVQGRGDPA